MQNEFYAVEIIDEDSVIIEGDENFHFFKKKDNAFKFLWKQFLNAFADKLQKRIFLILKRICMSGTRSKVSVLFM